jgi:hypothetical protein
MEVAMPDKSESPRITPPYLSYRTFQNYIATLKGGIPGRIDRSGLGNFSGIVQSQLLSALQYLELIDADGHPLELLEELADASPEGKKKLLTALLERRYAFLFSGAVNLSSATTRQLHEQFEKVGISGDTVRKSVSFFVLAAKDAGLPISKFIKTPRARAVGLRPGRPVAKANGAPMTTVSEGRAPMTPTQPKTPYQVLIEMLDPENMEEKEREAIWTLLQYLKKREVE